MNNRDINEMDELEPRVTPQPTLLKCMTTPSVPEVSMIFGKHPEPSSKRPRNPQGKQYETYASWKKDEFPIDPKIDSHYNLQIFPNSPSQSSLNPPPPNSLNFLPSTSTKVNSIPLKNPVNPKNSEIIRLKYPSTIQSSIQKRSILKNPQQERAELNSPSSPDCRQRKNPQSFDYSRSSLIASRCQHQIEVNPDQGTVKDLLLLVKSQNEQIRALQNQVERLLQAHEDNRANLSWRGNETPRSEDNRVRHENSPQRICQPTREIKIPPTFPPDDPAAPDLCLRYQADQMRNAIVEKKVSIGVMTSFEFSVQNNPFVTDSDHQINAVLRECGKNIVEPNEHWRNNKSSRNIIPGPLENINEDSESYPSSISRQSSNNTQISSDKTHFKVKNDSGNCRQNGCLVQHRNEESDENSRDFFVKAPIPAPRKITANKRTGNFQRSFENVIEENFYDRRCVDSRNNYNRTEENSRERLFGNRDCEVMTTDSKSLAAENLDETSLVLSSSDLRVANRAPSPDPSIHVEMREYSSDEEIEKRAPPVGWTFYKNIVGQVNRILHTIPDSKELGNNEEDYITENPNQIDGREEIGDSVKLATLERLKMLGISYAEHSGYSGECVQKKVTFDSSYCPRLDYQTALSQSTNTVTESNTSMHMKALALKYLSDEQLADLAVHKQGEGTGMKQKILNSIHGTNMSLATMNYLQRYCLVSGAPHTEAKGHLNAIRQKKLKHVVMTKEVHAQPMPRHHNVFNESTITKEPDNILDITTLKQQPKLL